MKVNSIDNKNWISIESKDEQPYLSFVFEASVNIEHGSYTGKNIDLHFLNFGAFVKELDAFITNRKLSPTLNGTYDSYIKFESRKNNSVFVFFNIGNAFAGYSETVGFSLSGEFEINTEYLNQIYDEFKKLEKLA